MVFCEVGFSIYTHLIWNLHGVSKGLVAQQLLSTMVERGKPPDFVLCIGDDRSDEDMFASIAMAQPSMASMSNFNPHSNHDVNDVFHPLS